MSELNMVHELFWFWWGVRKPGNIATMHVHPFRCFFMNTILPVQIRHPLAECAGKAVLEDLHNLDHEILHSPIFKKNRWLMRTKMSRLNSSFMVQMFRTLFRSYFSIKIDQQHGRKWYYLSNYALFLKTDRIQRLPCGDHIKFYIELQSNR